MSRDGLRVYRVRWDGLHPEFPDQYPERVLTRETRVRTLSEERAAAYVHEQYARELRALLSVTLEPET